MALVIMTMETSVKIYFEIDELKSDKQLRLRQRCFPVNFAKSLRTLFLQNTSGRLLLGYYYRDTSEVYSVYFFSFFMNVSTMQVMLRVIHHMFLIRTITKREKKINKKFQNLEYRFKSSCIVLNPTV